MVARVVRVVEDLAVVVVRWLLAWLYVWTDEAGWEVQR